MGTQTIILIDRLSQLRWRENDAYLYSVKSHIILPFILLKIGNNNKNVTFHSFSSKNSVCETQKLTSWVMINVLASFIMPQYHMSKYYCSVPRTIATLHNEGTFARVTIEIQWTHLSDWYFGKILSIIFYQRLNQVLFLKLQYFSQSCEYSMWPIRTFAECTVIKLLMSRDLLP